MWHYAFRCVRNATRSYLRAVTRLIHTCHLTHSCVWHDSFICVTWIIHLSVRCDSLVSGCAVTHLIHEWIHSCDLTHPYVWYNSCSVWPDSFIRVTWLIHSCDLTHSYVWYNSCSVRPDSSICVIWLIYMCVPRESFVSACHDSLHRAVESHGIPVAVGRRHAGLQRRRRDAAAPCCCWWLCVYIYKYI